METTRFSAWLGRFLAAALALVAAVPHSAAQVVVEVAPAGVSVRLPAAIGASGAPEADHRPMLLPTADFARNLSFQMDRVAPAAIHPQALSAELRGALQAQVLAGIPRGEAVATQNILVQALSNPQLLAEIQDKLRRTETPGNPSFGRDAAERLGGLAASARDERSRAELSRYTGELESVLTASLEGDDREFSRLFDGLVSRTDGSAALAVDARESGASGLRKILRPLQKASPRAAGSPKDVLARDEAGASIAGRIESAPAGDRSKPAWRRAAAWISARFKNPLVQVGASMGAAVIFGAGLWPVMGLHAAQAFGSIYLVEWSMSLDNLAVIAPIVYGAPAKHQPTVLRWSLLGSIVSRLAVVSGGVTLVHSLPWVFFVAGAFLLATALKTISPRHDVIALTMGRVKALFARRQRAAAPAAQSTGVRRWLTSPVAMIVLAAIGYDVLFSVDSVSVALGLSDKAFIIFMANVFSILGLRGLFTIYKRLEKRFEHMSKGTAAALIFVGARMILEPLLKIKLLGDMASTALVFGLLLAPVAYSMIADRIKATRARP